jgi:hypothetical protein
MPRKKSLKVVQTPVFCKEFLKSFRVITCSIHTLCCNQTGNMLFKAIKSFTLPLVFKVECTGLEQPETRMILVIKVGAKLIQDPLGNGLLLDVEIT